MEVPVLGIQKSDPAKRKFVYCISHSAWNDGFSPKYTFTHTKRSVIALQIRDQNPLLSKTPYGRVAKPEEYEAYFWMRDSGDARVRFLWERLQVSTRPDPSDAGMAYFLMTGDEQADPAKRRKLLEDHSVPAPVAHRSQIRLEAENFLKLEGYELEYGNNRAASHRLYVKPTGSSGAGRIRTVFDEPFAAVQGRYDVEIRYFDVLRRRQESFPVRVQGERQCARRRLEVAGRGQGLDQPDPPRHRNSRRRWNPRPWRSSRSRLGNGLSRRGSLPATWPSCLPAEARATGATVGAAVDAL